VTRSYLHINSVDFEVGYLYNLLLIVGESPLFYCSDRKLHSPIRNFELLDLSRTREIIERVVYSEGMELVDVELKGGPNRRILRIYIDKPTGVTHQDCELISDQVGSLLDIENLILGSYVLEVSSPGLTRKLTKESDYQRYVGRLVKIQTRDQIQGRRNFRGTLRGLEDDQVVVELEGPQSVRIPLHSITKSNLDFDF